MRRGSFAAAALLLMAAACTNEATTPPEQGQYRDVDCPGDVTIGIDLDAFGVTCGNLTVPMDRGDRSSPTIEVFVTRITSPAAPAPDPVLVVGTNLAEEMTYDGIAPLAERVHREVVIMDARGVGHSSPDASCPETREPLERWADGGVGNGEARSAFLDAVGICHDRVIASGIDPNDFGVSAMAADAEDLRRSLGFESWNVVSFGSASQVSLELLRRYPEHLRAVVMDSPAFGPVAPVEEAAGSLRYALEQVTSGCAADPPCRRAFGDLETSFDMALHALSERPVQAANPSGPPIVIDDVALVRVVRSVLADGHGEHVVELPRMIDAASRGDVEAAAQWLATDDAGCSGIRPTCTAPVSEGVLFGSICAGVEAPRAPFSDPIVAALAGDPLLAACSVWGSTSPADASLPVAAVPVLILVGATDAYAARPVVEAAAVQLPDAHVVEIPWQGHNVLGGSECARDIRNAWVDRPTAAPERSCPDSDRPPPFRV